MKKLPKKQGYREKDLAQYRFRAQYLNVVLMHEADVESSNTHVHVDVDDLSLCVFSDWQRGLPLLEDLNVDKRTKI